MTIPRIVKTELLDTSCRHKDSYTEFELMQRQGRISCHSLETFGYWDPRYAGYTAVHVRFQEIYRNYSRTRFVKGLELLILLVLYQSFGLSYNMLITISMWFMVVIWFLLAPFLVNPFIFELMVMEQDRVGRWDDWMRTKYGDPARSWQSWWEQELEKEHNKSSWGLCGTIIKILFAFRFFIYHHGLVHHFSSQVYKLSWIVVLTILVVIKAMSYWRETSRDGTPSRDYYRVTKTMIDMAVCILLIPPMVALVPWKDVSILALAFLVAGWGLLLIAQALGPLLRQSELIWFMVKIVAKYYDNTMAIIVHILIQIFAGFLFFTDCFQTPMLWNEARTARVARILCV